MFDLAIVGGDVALSGRDPERDDHCGCSRQNRGAVVARRDRRSKARPSTYRGLLVMPGAIDAHLHLGHGKDISRPRGPEDAAQETAAAAGGGVTWFMPYLMATEPFETRSSKTSGV